MLLSRREAIIGATAIAATAVVRIPARAAPPAVNFLVLGDWGRDGASHQQDVADAMGRSAKQIGSRFVVTVGDNFYDNGFQSADDPQWQSSFEHVYTAPSLQTPWYASLGNHDYRGNPQAQLEYAGSSKRWRLPSRCYKIAGVDIGAPHLDLFILDTSPLVNKYRTESDGPIRANVLTQDTRTQLAWLDRELAASRAPWKLVAGHHPLFSGGSSHGNTPEMIAQVEPILKRHGVQAYLAGHDHDLQFLDRDGLSLIQTGAGSEVRPVQAVEGTEYCNARSGFTCLRSDPDMLSLEFVDYTGGSLFKRNIGREIARSRRAA